MVIRPRSEPQPDLLLLRPRAVSYSRELPTSEDVLLAVEVADTLVRFDRLVKARLYARAGIAEFYRGIDRYVAAWEAGDVSPAGIRAWGGGRHAPYAHLEGKRTKRPGTLGALKEVQYVNSRPFAMAWGAYFLFPTSEEVLPPPPLIGGTKE